MNNHKYFIKNNKILLKSEQRLKSEGLNVFTEEINEIALSSNDDKRIQPIDSIETYAYGTNEGIIHRQEKMKCSNIIK